MPPLPPRPCSSTPRSAATTSVSSPADSPSCSTPHGPGALERAIAAALDADAPHLAGVRHLIDQHRQQSDKPPPLPLALPDDPRLRNLHVRPHDLADYDRLHDDSATADEDSHQDDDNDQDSNA